MLKPSLFYLDTAPNCEMDTEQKRQWTSRETFHRRAKDDLRCPESIWEQSKYPCLWAPQSIHEDMMLKEFLPFNIYMNKKLHCKTYTLYTDKEDERNAPALNLSMYLLTGHQWRNWRCLWTSVYLVYPRRQTGMLLLCSLY